jgi:hypothetical protein
MEQRYQRLCAERDELYDKFTQGTISACFIFELGIIFAWLAALHSVKQKSGFKHLLLEKKLAAAAEEAERQSLALAEVNRTGSFDINV